MVESLNTVKNIIRCNAYTLDLFIIFILTILVFNFNWLGFNHEGTLIGSSCGLLKNWENAISSFPTSHKRNVNFEETTRKSRLLIHNSVLNRAYNTFLNNQVSKVFEIEKTWKKTKSKYIIFKRTYNSMENS